ncbi:MAG: TlpA family protein disulfide reductase [Verrucomicrobia bacterium]|nr:TlpA family protein disulfide reductase [Verrucomicrobiota bacterium]
MKRLEGKPFVLLGMNSDQDRHETRRRCKAEGITWRSWFDGGTGGPIAKQYGVRSWPTIYVLDANGVIRYKNVRGEAMDQAVDTLLAQMSGGKAGK